MFRKVWHSAQGFWKIRKIAIGTTWARMKFESINFWSPVMRFIFLETFLSWVIELKKIAPLYRHWGSVQAVRPIGGVEVYLYFFMTNGTRSWWGVSVTPGRSLTRKRAGTHCTGGWVSPRAGLDRCEISHPPPGFNPRTVQPVATHYTDYATRNTGLLYYWSQI